MSEITIKLELSIEGQSSSKVYFTVSENIESIAEDLHRALSYFIGELNRELKVDKTYLECKGI